VTTVGPEVPEEGQFPVPPCTFEVTITRVSASVPVAAGDFTIVDELGQLHQPQVTTITGGPPPASATPGRTLALTVQDVLPTGSGTLRWAPGGGRPVVSWDFDVEID